MARTEKQITEFLQSEDGKRNAERFIKALKERRILCSVKHVSSSGMTRTIAMREVSVGKDGQVSILQFDWFFEQLGYRYDKNHNGISVGGCGMDMIFATINSIASTLQYRGFDVPEDYTCLADSYLSV